MSKVLKILFIMLIFSLLCFTISYGVNTTNEENITSNTIYEENTSLEEILTNENNDISTDDTTYDGTSNHYESQNNQNTNLSSSYTVSSVNNIPESGLSVNDILNIIIIVIGILLILLAIAILIRLKNK